MCVWGGGGARTDHIWSFITTSMALASLRLITVCRSAMYTFKKVASLSRHEGTSTDRIWSFVGVGQLTPPPYT